MKKIILSSLVAVSLYSDVTNIMPYVANLDFSDSTKKSGTISGLYYSVGNLSYLLELDYSKTDIKYKNSSTPNLKQDDYTITYARYFPTWMIKGGIHKLNTTDTVLGDGTVLITALGGYKTIGYDRYNYGVEGYWTYYKDGYDDNGLQKKINIYQLTPYYSYSKAIDINTRNNIGFKINYIYAKDFNTKDYISYEFEDTLFYKRVYATLNLYTGSLKTAVRDGGHTVYNLKDKYEDGGSLKIGYFSKDGLTISGSYGINYFLEDGATKDSKNEVATLSINYKF